jgi:multicomponent Na+:H+ antiporter subunit G
MIGEILALVGAVLILLAAIGVLRLQDAFERMHALTKATTLGVVLVLLGAAVYMNQPNDWTSLLLAASMQLVTSPIAANLIGRSSDLLRQAKSAVGVDPDDAAP